VTQQVLCYGELLLRLSPDTERNWLQNNSMPIFVGGAELNAATALAKWNVPVSYFTALPDNYLSKQILSDLNQKNINCSPVFFHGDRIGIYYLAQGLDLKNAGVIYDRANSSFATLRRGMLDWDLILKDVNWFHFSAICPAISADAADVCLEALQAASSKNITISVDLNYRSKLWKYGKQPLDIMPALAAHCDLIMGNVWAAENMLGIPVDADLERKKQPFLRQSEKTSRAILKAFPKCSQVANTFRFDENGSINYYATLFKDNQLFVSKEHETDHVVDKIGSGDCFMAGLIYGNQNNLPPQEVIDFAAAAAFNKLFIKGDATTSSVEEIKKGHLSYA
jgi:2-dehydro-3-deoxygluconokinase